MKFDELLALNILGNTVYNYLMSLGIFIITWTAIFIIKKIILIQIKEITKKTKIQLANNVLEYVQGISIVFYFVLSIYVSTLFLNLPELIRIAIYYTLLLTIAYYIIKLFNKFVEYFFSKIENEQQKKFQESDFTQLHLMRDIVKAVVWFIAILLLLSNLGFNVTTLIAGLGIGGIAVAFALQNVLADIFASFSIYFDKPFKKGDFIITGTESGTIKKIGLKTTRIESLQGEEIVIPNQMLVNSTIHNYKKMNFRSTIFSIGVDYTTPIEKLEKIPLWIKEIIENAKINDQKIANVNRVHFKNFGPSGLIYEIMYTVKSNEYNVFMDVQQQINLEIMKKFKKEKIDFAYPTQAIYLKKE